MSDHIPTEVVNGVHRPSSAVPIEGTTSPSPGARPSGWRPKTNEHLVNMSDILAEEQAEQAGATAVATPADASTTPLEASSGELSLDTPTPQESTGTSSGSPSRTVVDLNEGEQSGAAKTGNKGSAAEEWIDSEENNVAALAEEGKKEQAAGGAEVKLSQGRKWFLLGIFCVAQVRIAWKALRQYVDTLGYSGLFIFTDQILNDLQIQYETSSWILTAYSVTFASFLLFWGRVSDLYSARPVFAYGFFGVAVFNLVISFMPEQYSYFILRAVCGIFGACTIPAAYRLILAIFEPQELNVALTAVGMAGALANVTGLIIAGFFGFITAEGQMSAWRWFFRGVAIIVFPFAIAAIFIVPKTKPAMADQCTTAMDRFKRLDLIGCGSMLLAIIALIIGLTFGASYGWKTVQFLVPFLVAWPLFAFFFVWEARMPEGYALLPSNFWRIPNMPLLMFIAVGVFPWWATNQLVFVERFLAVFNNTPIISAVRMLPEGIAALVIGAVFPPLIAKLGGTKWPMVFGAVIQAVGFIIFIFLPDGSIYNNNYWRWYVPAMIIGSAATMAVFLGLNITIMTSVPPEASGVASAVFQVCLQLGAVVSLSIQAGLLTVNPGTFENYANIKVSFWFQVGWFLLNAILLALFFRSGKAAPGSEAAETGAAKVEGPKEV